MTTTETQTPTTDESPAPNRPSLSTMLWVVAALSFFGTLALWWLGDLPAEPDFAMAFAQATAFPEPAD